MKRCDFGVVLLSEPFFSKQWPQAELDVPFALETQSRKIILPIWKGVTKEDIAKYSPLLAGKIAVSASHGLPKVLQEIRLAVSYSERTRELSVLDVATQRVKALEQTLANKQRERELLWSEKGVQLIPTSLETIRTTIRNILPGVGDQSSVLKFAFSKSQSDPRAQNGPSRYRISSASLA